MSGFFTQVAEWFTDAETWIGPRGVPVRLLEHIEVSALSLAIAGAIALPVGLFIGHKRKGELLVVSIANLGRAIPSFAILVFFVPITIRLGLGIGFWPTVIAMVLLAIPPILTNTYVAVQSVEADTLEAARGMGMSEFHVLRRLELSLGAPLIIAGFRIAAVQVVATATLAAVVGWGGLGRFIVDGFAVLDRGLGRIFGGALFVALLAVGTELAFGLLERAVTPRTTSRERRAPLPVPEPGPTA